jgi:serine/threonine protein kinase
MGDDAVEKLDRFELIAELASGGMATVYLARLLGLGGVARLFAIKRLHPHLAKDREFVDMFIDEARLAARIRHPNVVPIHEIGITERGYYLVMDYVEGDTAARLFARAAQDNAKIAPGVGIRIVLDTLAGLHAAHELQDDNGKPLEIVHRDVSPQNVLVGVDGVARITDFGVARAASRLSVTRTGQLKGKLAYMAPEQARSKANVDRRADVFAMGIVLWETLAQRRLFKGDSEAETLNRVLYEEIPTLRSAVPTIPAALDAIAMKALTRDADKRFASCAEMADALEKAATSLKALATQKDVATCVNEVMATELEQQRDAVRVWMARSEPSHPSSRRTRAAQDSVTKIEARSSTLPPSVSSVSSMVNVPLPPSSGALDVERVRDEEEPTGPAARTRRGRAWSVGMIATSLVIAWAVVAWRTPAHPGGSASHVDPNAPATVNATVNATPDLAPPSFPGPIVLKDAGRDAAPPIAPAPPPSPRRHHAAQVPSRPQVEQVEQPEPAPSAVPDDITRNPYR